MAGHASPSLASAAASAARHVLAYEALEMLRTACKNTNAPDVNEMKGVPGYGLISTFLSDQHPFFSPELS